MKRLATTALRSSVSDTINRVQYGGERVLLERHGKPVAAIISPDDLDLLMVLEDKVDLAAARKALKEAGSKSLDEVRAGLGM